MARTAPSLALGFAVLGLALQPTTAGAATSDEELWAELSTKGDIAEGVDLKLELETRRRDGPNEYIFGAEANFDTAPNLALGGGIEIHEIDGFTEVRPYQQLTFAAGPLDFRTRIEERFFDDADQLSLRLRQRARLRQKLAQQTTGFLSAELLYQLQDRTENGPERIDQWRFNAGLTQRVGDIEITPAYLFQIRPRDNGATRHTHVAQIGLAYRF